MEAIVVGSGPNGLAAAITLAQAGRNVRVREAQETIGGGARSVGWTLPGFLHDRCSAIHPMAAGSPFFRALALDKFGLEWIHPELALAHPLDDGRAVILDRSLEATCAGFAEDGTAWRALMGPLVNGWDRLAAETLRPILHFPRHPFFLARFGLRACQSAVGLARRLFAGEHTQALFAGLAAHSFLPLDAPASAAIGLMLAAAAHSVGWPMPRGGAQKISDALAACLRSLGGEIETGRPVDDVRELSAASAVLLDLSAWNAARIAGPVLPARFCRKLARFPHGPGVFKIDYALREPIPWKADACRRAGTVHLGGTMEEIAQSERDVTEGRLAERPFVLLTQPSMFDPSRAPAGKHVAWAYCHVPYGSNVDRTEAIENQIERFAPGFRDCILLRHASDAGSLAMGNANLEGGDISGGACDWWHLLSRPKLSFTPYQLPARGLYLCSSSTPPGGGVHGMCGYHAARAALASELA